MKTYRIASYPGDGIGPEVIAATLPVLAAAESRFNFELQTKELPWGFKYWQETGRVAPENFLEVLRPFDAILLGALGWPAELPDHVTLAPLVEIRQKFDQYACMRPAKLYPGVRGPLADKGPQEVDFLVIRENSEGEYVRCGGRFKQGQADEVALETAVHTRKGIERILRFGFEMARRRRQRLTMATKSNAMQYGYVLWDETLEQLRDEFPDIDVDRQHADAAAMNFVRRPESFDVVVASNLFGDLLTDLGGVLAGGLGLAPSTNTNPQRDFPSMFEPVHGSAPDIAGRGLANPIAAIACAAMMLDWLGEAAAATAIHQAIADALAAGAATSDLGGQLTTDEMGREIEKRIGG